jgi:hypothetical protein
MDQDENIRLEAGCDFEAFLEGRNHEDQAFPNHFHIDVGHPAVGARHGHCGGDR